MSSTLSPETIIQPGVINLNLTARTAPEAIRELHSGLSASTVISDAAVFLRDLLARQALGANCLDQEIALPHARTLAVNKFVLGIGRSADGVFFDEQHSAIRLVIMVGVPIDAVTEYLRWTAHLVRALRSPTVREALLTAPTVDVFKGVCSLCIPTTK